MNAQLMRRALALPAPLLRPLHRTAPIGAAVPPAARQLNLSHPSGWLAAAAELQTYAGPHGEVHYERNGVTAFALGTEGVDAHYPAVPSSSWVPSPRASRSLSSTTISAGGAQEKTPAGAEGQVFIGHGKTLGCLSYQVHFRRPAAFGQGGKREFILGAEKSSFES